MAPMNFKYGGCVLGKTASELSSSAIWFASDSGSNHPFHIWLLVEKHEHREKNADIRDRR